MFGVSSVVWTVAHRGDQSIWICDIYSCFSVVWLVFRPVRSQKFFYIICTSHIILWIFVGRSLIMILLLTDIYFLCSVCVWILIGACPSPWHEDIYKPRGWHCNLGVDKFAAEPGHLSYYSQPEAGRADKWCVEWWTDRVAVKMDRWGWDGRDM
jgi:hypothetical protein